MSTDDWRDAARAELLELLFDRIAADTYPSTTMLNLAEDLLTPEEIPAYARLLVTKAREDTYPSIPMLNRLHRLL